MSNYRTVLKYTELPHIVFLRDGIKNQRETLLNELAEKRLQTNDRYACRSTSNKIGSYSKKINEINEVISERIKSVGINAKN